MKRNSKVNFIEDHNHALGIKDTKSEWKNGKPIINDSIIPEKDYQMRRTQHLLKRQALPQSVKWVGSSTHEEGFETFLNLITAHLGQQTHLVYITIPAFQAIWLQIGDIAQTLGIARRMKLHSSLNYITEEQFIHDITWLFNALNKHLGVEKVQILYYYMQSHLMK